ncbi:hypothetical protein BKI52_16575 [marine bacterium AO1-C]|nr:hypothetical protein BKI52_16575 [marine bacterium AO1-C]
MKQLKTFTSLSLLWALGILFTCQPTFAQINQEETTHMLVGKINQQGLKKTPYNQWFSKNYKAYEVNNQELKLDKKDLKNLKIKIFLGTWCGDSKREVPRFLKVAAQLGIAPSQIEMIALKRDRKSPDGEYKGLNIHHVPTFIVSQGTQELGRITEEPVQSLEADLVKIIQQKPYTPYFAGSEYLLGLFKQKGNAYVQQNLKSIGKTLKPQLKNQWELLRLAYILSINDQPKAALTTCHLADQLYPKSISIWLAIARYSPPKTATNAIRKHYQKVLKVDPYNYEAIYGLKKLDKSGE